jgi:hypothetical protein
MKKNVKTGLLICAALLLVKSKAISQTDTSRIVCVDREVMVQVIADLEAYDDLREEVSAVYEQSRLQKEYTEVMERAVATEKSKVIVCRDEVDVLQGVIAINENKIKVTETKLRRVKTWYTIALGVLVGALIIK